MREAMTGDMGLFDPKMMTGKAGKACAGLNVGLAVVAEKSHKKQLAETGKQMASAINDQKSVTSQLENIAKS